MTSRHVTWRLACCRISSRFAKDGVTSLESVNWATCCGRGTFIASPEFVAEHGVRGSAPPVRHLLATCLPILDPGETSCQAPTHTIRGCRTDLRRSRPDKATPPPGNPGLQEPKGSPPVRHLLKEPVQRFLNR